MASAEPSPIPRALTVIRAAPLTLAEDLREIWAYRDLLYFLIWRDLKVRYRQTILGLFWILIQPLGTMLLFVLLLGRTATASTAGVPYPIYVYAGMWPWTILGAAIMGSAGSVITNGALITKVYFPRAIVPAAVVLGRAVDLLVGLPVALALCLLAGSMSWRLFTLPFWALHLLLLGLGVGLWLTSTAVRYRDMLLALPFALQLGLVAAPILYPLEVIPEPGRSLLRLNPVTGLVGGFRWALTGAALDGTALVLSIVVTLGIWVVGVSSFRSAARRFADLV